MGSSVRRSRRALHAVLAAAAGAGLLSLPSAAQAYDVAGTGNQQSKTWQYSLSIGPSLFAPRMGSFNEHELASAGVDWAKYFSAATGNSVTARGGGFQKIGLGYGVQTSLQYEFDEELRGGLQIGFLNAATSGSINFDTLVFSGTTFVGSSSSLYSVSERVSLPVLRIGLSLQKVFRFENEPRFHLYVGGWGNIGLLVGARINRTASDATTNTSSDFSITLRGQGWGAGGLGGLEYQLSRRSAVYAETGFDYFVIRNPEESGTAGGVALNAGPFTSTGGIPVRELDFSGVFLRIGVKAGLGRRK